MERVGLELIERSLIKTYRKSIWAKFVKACVEYKLVCDGDKIAVAISGGKDSLLMAKLFQELKRINVVHFDVFFISMNPGFSDDNLKSLESNCEYLGIPVVIKKSDVFEVAERIAGEEPCYMCARMRRGFLYRMAQDLGCNKLALGHHFDDVIETTMLNVLYAGCYKTMLPKLDSDNFKGLTLIRPLYLVKEADIIKWKNYSHLETMNCGCKVASGILDSKRKEIKELIKKLKETNEFADINIFRSAENVNLEGILGFHRGKDEKTFLDLYEEEKK